jgi:guanylate kinase
MGRFVVLAGPSCVGKGPLVNALRRIEPELTAPLEPVVLYNDRAPRPGEQDGVDYHFRDRETIEQMKPRDDVEVMEVRGDLQAVDVAELTQSLEHGDRFFEGNPFVGSMLAELELPPSVQRLNVFLSPMSRVELEWLMQRDADLPRLVADVMRRKLLRRTKKHKGILARDDLQEVERRCRSCLGELTFAHRFDCVIANHDGEDSENWSAFYWPLGDAGRSVRLMTSLLRGEPVDGLEHWSADLLSRYAQQS